MEIKIPKNVVRGVLLLFDYLCLFQRLRVHQYKRPLWLPGSKQTTYICDDGGRSVTKRVQ